MNATADSYQSMLTREVRVCGKKVQLWYAKRFCGGRGQIFLEAKDSLCEAKPAGAPAPLESERKATQNCLVSDVFVLDPKHLSISNLNPSNRKSALWF